MRKGSLLAAALCVLCQAHAQPGPEPAPRASLAAGMGVEYVSFADVTTLINATIGPSSAVPRFTSAVEFFGACAVPITERWVLKLEYAYMLESFSPAGAYGPASISVVCHMPSIILQYMLLDRGVYNIRAGAGGGVHFGRMEEKYSYIDAAYTGKGAGMVVEIEANTAFGDHLYAFLGGNIRWEAIGRIADKSGVSPGVGSGGLPVTLHAFGAGARLGASYLF
jgi:hypothetical protein